MCVLVTNNHTALRELNILPLSVSNNESDKYKVQLHLEGEKRNINLTQHILRPVRQMCFHYL